MQGVLVYPDDPEARKRISENFTEVMFEIFIQDFLSGGPLMKEIKGIIAKEINVLEKFKDYNNEKIKTCEESTKTAEYIKGYVDALKQQNRVLDKQLKILKMSD